MEEIENTQSLMSKTSSEMTGADVLKLTAICAAAFVAVPAVVAAGRRAVVKFADWNHNRKLKNEILETTAQEIETV